MRTNPTPTSSSEVETDSELHNIVALTPAKKLFQVEVEKEASSSAPPVPSKSTVRGDYKGVPELQPRDKASRLVRSLAGESLPESSESYQSGMGFGILPLRSDPTPANGSSYLINARRLNPRTVWSHGRWNEAPSVRRRLRLDPELLIVARANRTIMKINLSTGSAVQLQRSDLRRNPEMWKLLRNGLVVGQVEYVDEVSATKQLASLVNLASFGASKDTEVNPQGAFTGTWDFKWPHGSQIRVRLQGGTLEAQAEVKRLASQWLPADPTQNPGNLSFVFLELNGPPADTDYDVLVSLDALPSSDDNHARLPQSDLGTYCQRSPLDLPTTYVGCPAKGIKNSDGTMVIGDAYFSSPAFKHIVLHEFGHVLGLPHINQHPGFESQVSQSAAALKARRQEVNDLLFNEALLDDDFMTENFGMTWPGDTISSDWPTLQVAQPSAFANHIMCALPIEGLLPGNAPGAQLSLAYKTSLTESDRMWLIQMYGP